MPIAASRVAITMNARYVSERSVLSLTCCSTCSQRTASAGDPLASRIARLLPADIETATSWTTIAPSRSTPAAQRRATTTLSFLARDVADDDVASGLERCTLEVHDVRDRIVRPQQGRTRLTSAAGTIKRSVVTMRL